ncbi:MAG: ABC transporter substrate-binding protein [Ruminococcaceae bacterium]|nr:ABC transporter substrate-binding protein [Oscillospiraceae bacterium]
MFKRFSKKAVASVLCMVIIATFLSCTNPYLQNSQSVPTLKTEAEPTPEENRNDPEKATGTISLGLYGFDTLNPLETKNDAIREYMSLVYDSLIKYDNECRPVACVADNWETTDGGITWKIKIKENVFFHDGSNMTVYDVKNTLEWIKNNNSFYSFCAESVLSYKILSQYEMEIVLTSPDALFISKMCFPILKSEEIGTNFKVPNGTGMYKYISAQGNTFLFEINKNYFGNFPKIKNVEIQTYSDADSLYDSNSDVILGFGDDTIKYAKKENSKVARYESNTVCAMVPAEKVKAEVKHFVNNAIDKELVVRAAMADCACVKNVLFAQETYFMKNFHSTENIKYSESKPESLRLIVNKNDEELVRMAYIIEKQLDEKGVACDLSEYKDEEFSVILESGEYDFAFMNYQMKPFPDAEDFFAQNGKLNFNKFYDESVNSLILSINNAYKDSEISGVTDNGSLYDYVNNQTLKLSVKLLETLPIICLCGKYSTVTVSDKVEGVNLYNFTFWNTIDITNWSVKDV